MQEREADCFLGGCVITDDACLDGELCGKLGRGSEILPFISVVDVADRPVRIRFDRVGGFCSEKVSEWVKLHLAPQNTLVSDDLSCFTAVTVGGCRHELHVVCATTAAPKCLVLARFMHCWVT